MPRLLLEIPSNRRMPFTASQAESYRTVYSNLLDVVSGRVDRIVQDTMHSYFGRAPDVFAREVFLTCLYNKMHGELSEYISDICLRRDNPYPDEDSDSDHECDDPDENVECACHE